MRVEQPFFGRSVQPSGGGGIVKFQQLVQELEVKRKTVLTKSWRPKSWRTACPAVRPLAAGSGPGDGGRPRGCCAKFVPPEVPVRGRWAHPAPVLAKQNPLFRWKLSCVGAALHRLARNAPLCSEVCDSVQSKKEKKAPTGSRGREQRAWLRLAHATDRRVLSAGSNPIAICLGLLGFTAIST
jgi:hypothetical protein